MDPISIPFLTPSKPCSQNQVSHLMRKSIVFLVDWLLSSPISIWDILVMSLSLQHQSFSNSLGLKEKVCPVRLAIFLPPTFIFSLLSVTKAIKFLALEQYIHTSCVSPELSQSNFLLEASCTQSLQGNVPGKGCTLDSFQICLDTVTKKWNTNVKKIVIISSPIFIKTFHFFNFKRCPEAK